MIENDLYHNTTINLIYDLVGEFRKRKFIAETVDQDLDKKAKWKKSQESLEKEINVLEEILLSEMDVISPGKIENKAQKGKTYFAYDLPTEDKLKCHILGKNDHNVNKDFRNRDAIQYFVCKTFVEMSQKRRFNKLREKSLCHKCLAPGAHMKNV